MESEYVILALLLHLGKQCKVVALPQLQVDVS